MSNFSIVRGDTYIEDLAVKDSAGAALDITGGKLYFTAKTSYNVADESASVALTSPSTGITITDAANGLARMIITAAQSATLTGGQTYVYDIQFKDVNGNITTLDSGSMDVRQDVTQSTD